MKWLAEFFMKLAGITRPTGVMLVGGLFTTHYTTTPEIVQRITSILDAPIDRVKWNKETGLELPPNTIPRDIAEIWVFSESGIRIYNFRLNGADFCYAWVRHDTYWTDADYNEEPAPHGDEPVRRYNARDLDEMISLLQMDMYHKL